MTNEEREAEIRAQGHGDASGADVTFLLALLDVARAEAKKARTATIFAAISATYDCDEPRTRERLRDWLRKEGIFT